MAVRYYVDYLFIVAYTIVICSMLVHARRALADRSDDPALHRLAHWGGLIPVWALIGSDVTENTLTLWFLGAAAKDCADHLFLCRLLALSTGIKLLSIAAVTCFFLWVLYHVATKKRVHVLI
jgi:hypothetical protein